ncbi:hypothetical protein [Virgibacillus salexigens]|uniref:hypothetical protein n=1 Tax=Virgibacillus salexigens TaxID=61016 RepID=UPI0019095F5F|nr:hypothetical protein [Virgibacillus salexigens]
MQGFFNITEHINGEIPSEFNADTLGRANALREYFIQHAKKAHGVMGVNEDDEDAVA